MIEVELCQAGHTGTGYSTFRHARKPLRSCDTGQRVPGINLVMRILESGLVGNDIIELLGQFLTEIARYNTWFASKVDGKVSPETHAALYTLYRDVAPKIYEAWKQYEIVCSTASPVGEQSDDMKPEYYALKAILRGAIDELSAARESLS